MSLARNRLHQMIRVNQAGEYGAKRIYEGQLSVLKNSPSAPTIEHMRDQELHHLETFNKLMVEGRVRPTLLQPLWHVAGFVMGAGTAFLGEKAAMACTVAVEEVIDEHYRSQLDELDEDHQDLKDTINQFRLEELEHREIALDHGAEETRAYPLLTTTIKTASRFAIWLSTKV